MSCTAATRPSTATTSWPTRSRRSWRAILEVAAAAGKKAKVMRDPERMAYGLVEFELCDPDGYRVCISGDAPAGATVKAHEE
jgi:uncharacterized glyoxalase superfamily protein PhnB